MIKLLFEIMAASSLVLFDLVFYEALDVIRKHAKIDYFQTGHHDLSIRVKGTGMIANLLRSVVERFNFKKNVTINLSNESEYPNPDFPLPRNKITWCKIKPKNLSNFHYFRDWQVYKP